MPDIDAQHVRVANTKLSDFCKQIVSQLDIIKQLEGFKIRCHFSNLEGRPATSLVNSAVGKTFTTTGMKLKIDSRGNAARVFSNSALIIEDDPESDGYGGHGSVIKCKATMKGGYSMHGVICIESQSTFAANTHFTIGMQRKVDGAWQAVQQEFRITAPTGGKFATLPFDFSLVNTDNNTNILTDDEFYPYRFYFLASAGTYDIRPCEVTIDSFPSAMN